MIFSEKYLKSSEGYYCFFKPSIMFHLQTKKFRKAVTAYSNSDLMLTKQCNGQVYCYLLAYRMQKQCFKTFSLENA